MNGTWLWIMFSIILAGSSLLVVRYGFGTKARNDNWHDYRYGDSGSAGASGIPGGTDGGGSP